VNQRGDFVKANRLNLNKVCFSVDVDSMSINKVNIVFGDDRNTTVETSADVEYSIKSDLNKQIDKGIFKTKYTLPVELKDSTIEEIEQVVKKKLTELIENEESQKLKDLIFVAC